jgi:N-acetylglucosamine kinase-like BadF-type ATPase
MLVEGDEFATHAGAFGGGYGVVVLAGTGSFAFGRASDGSTASAH